MIPVSHQSMSVKSSPLFLAGRGGRFLPLFALTLTTVLMGSLPRSASALEFTYRNHAQMGRLLKSMVKRYPDISSLMSIGKSYRNRDLYVITIGKYAKTPGLLVPNVKYIANMHGNEVVGREMLFHLAEYFLEGYGTNDTIRTFLDKTTVHLMPTMNPDGFSSANVRDCTSVRGRGNAYNYDLNRNFPDPHKRHPDTMQRETNLVDKWTSFVPFVLSANLHGGAEVVNYPWDSLEGDMTMVQYSASPDDDVFRHLSLTFSRSHPTMHQGASCSDRFQDGITNGANWYPVLGGMADYMYRKGRGYELLIEMSCCKYPDPSTLPEFWEKNRDAMVNLLYAVHMGVKGIVYNQGPDEARNPIHNASVSVVGREEIVTYTSRAGEFYKLLLPGNYTLQVSAPGYEPQTIPFTVDSQDNVTVLYIMLTTTTSTTTSGYSGQTLPTVTKQHDVSLNMDDPRNPQGETTRRQEATTLVSSSASTLPTTTKIDTSIDKDTGESNESSQDNGVTDTPTDGSSTKGGTNINDDDDINPSRPIIPKEETDNDVVDTTLTALASTTGTTANSDVDSDFHEDNLDKPSVGTRPIGLHPVPIGEETVTTRSQLVDASTAVTLAKGDKNDDGGLGRPDGSAVRPPHSLWPNNMTNRFDGSVIDDDGKLLETGTLDGIDTGSSTPLGDQKPTTELMDNRDTTFASTTSDDGDDDDDDVTSEVLIKKSNHSQTQPLGGGASSVTSPTPRGNDSQVRLFQAVARVLYTFLIIFSSTVLSS